MGFILALAGFALFWIIGGWLFDEESRYWKGVKIFFGFLAVVLLLSYLNAPS